MFLRKPGLVLSVFVGFILLGGALTARAAEQAAVSRAAAAVDPSDSFFVAVDINHTVYALGTVNQEQQRVRVGPGDSAAVADFDNDGYCEVVAITTTIGITNPVANLYLYEPAFTSQFERTFTQQVVSTNAYPLADFYVSGKWGDSAVGDFDGDGRMDVAFSGKGCSGSPCDPTANRLVQLILNKAAGWQRVQVSLDQITGRGYEQIAGLDDGSFNGDARWDLAAQHYWEGSGNFTHLLFGTTAATVLEDTSIFTNTVAEASGGTSSLVAGDFDEDGHMDLIIGQDDDGDPGQAWLYVGDGAGGFTYQGEAYDTNAAVETGSDQNGAGFADAYDFNGDGHLDIIAPAERIGILLFLGDGTGSFNPVPVVINTETMDWFKVAAPPVSEEPCLWSRAYTVHLPVIFR